MSQRKYPEATDYAICSLIGGFFFLRFINPAIVTPQAYMLVEGVPAKHPRRTLTLVRVYFQPFRFHLRIFASLDCEDAAKPRKQALVCEGDLHGHTQPFRRKQ